MLGHPSLATQNSRGRTQFAAASRIFEGSQNRADEPNSPATRQRLPTGSYGGAARVDGRESGLSARTKPIHESAVNLDSSAVCVQQRSSVPDANEANRAVPESQRSPRSRAVPSYRFQKNGSDEANRFEGMAGLFRRNRSQNPPGSGGFGGRRTTVASRTQPAGADSSGDHAIQTTARTPATLDPAPSEKLRTPAPDLT